MAFIKELAPYMFELPKELIAQEPPCERGQSRLMTLDRADGQIGMVGFTALPDLLPPASLLVFNEVKVTPARLLGHKLENNGQLEAFVLDIPPTGSPVGELDIWCLVKPGRRVKTGAELVFEHPESSRQLFGHVIDIAPDGRRLIRFNFKTPPLEILEEIGHMPLPSYIKRPDNQADRERYQTVYAKTPGAVAAPTAGLHFSEKILKDLKGKSHEIAEVTLKVSAGTFSPLTKEQLSSGRLHSEHIEVPEATVKAVLKAKKEGRKVVAVGTTTARALEWAAENGQLQARSGWGDIFIRPGYEFKAIDALLTNFHLPGSSLLMMVSALAGRERLLKAYQEAIASGFRFYSYGDAMLIV